MKEVADSGGKKSEELESRGVRQEWMWEGRDTRGGEAQTTSRH